MFATNRMVLAGAALVALLVLPSCNSEIDQADEAHVVLEAQNITIPPVTAARDTTTGVCTFTITNATATFKNLPKNSLAGVSPFNDVNMLSVHVTYAWPPGLPALLAADFGVGGTIPANGSGPAQFAVINAADLLPYVGASASLGLKFHGRTIAGDDVFLTTGGTLTVNSCQ